MDFSQRIIQMRNNKGMSTNKLAKMAGISQSFMRDIEMGKSQPTIDTLEKICAALDIELVDLFLQDSSEMPVQHRRLIDSVRYLTPDQADALNQFIKSITDNAVTSDISVVKADEFDYDAHNEEARRTFRQALADEPELLNFWLEQEDRENLQIFMSQAKTLEPEDIKDIVRKIKQVEDEEAASY